MNTATKWYSFAMRAIFSTKQGWNEHRGCVLGHIVVCCHSVFRTLLVVCVVEGGRSNTWACVWAGNPVVEFLAVKWSVHTLTLILTTLNVNEEPLLFINSLLLSYSNIFMGVAKQLILVFCVNVCKSVEKNISLTVFAFVISGKKR